VLTPVTKSVHYFVIQTFYTAFMASEIIYLLWPSWKRGARAEKEMCRMRGKAHGS